MFVFCGTKKMRSDLKVRLIKEIEVEICAWQPSFGRVEIKSTVLTIDVVYKYVNISRLVNIEIEIVNK